MEPFDSSPSYIRARSSSDAKKENSPQAGSDCDEVVSVGSSTCGSTINGPFAATFNKNGVKHRTSNKKTLKNFGNVRSFRRRAKSRVIPYTIRLSDEKSLAGSSQSSPRYLKATTSSEGKKTNSQACPRVPRHSESSFDGSDKNSSHPNLASPSLKPLRTLSRTSSRNVRILIKKTSFMPKKKSALNHSKDSEDVSVDRATYSSTIKDSKFHEPVELHSGGMETEKSSAIKVCRYHHCSLHGHCLGSHDPVPSPKRFLYTRRRLLKKHIIPKTESMPEENKYSDRKKKLQESQIVPAIEPLNQDRISDNITSTCAESKNDIDSRESYPQQEAQLHGDEYNDTQESHLVEVALGETSFPERSYQENLNILRKYSQEQDFGGTSFGRNNYRSRCSCNNRGEVTSVPGRAEADSSLRKVTFTNPNVCNNEIPQKGPVNVLDTSSAALFKKPNEASGRDCPETPVVFDEITERNSASSSTSYSQASSDSNSEEEVDITTESTSSEDSNVNEVVQEEHSQTYFPVQEGNTLQFSKPRHISMWCLIQHHMSSNLAAEPANKSLNDESLVDGANSLLAKESTTSSRDIPDSDVGGRNNYSETREIELRKLFAIKLVREAIEKILLPEVQDQISDDQSVTSESIPQPELMEKNQSKGSDAERGEANVSFNPKEESATADDASIREIRKTERQDVRKFEKKAPKHWSNLKKWILLQRFISELEKVKKFIPRKLWHLPLNSDPETEKVNLRPQTVDERKGAEEWMLDYALRQAVSQLGPTQKRKVSLLIKAFETVIPPQEDSQVQFRIPRLRENSLDIGGTCYKADESVASDNNVPIVEYADKETDIKMNKQTEKVCDVKDSYGESSVKFQKSSGERIQELTSKQSVFSSTICTSMDGLPSSKEENPRGTTGDHANLKGIHKDTNVSLRSNYFDGDLKHSNAIKPEDPDYEEGGPSSTAQSLILDVNRKMVATKNAVDHVTERRAISTLQGLQEDSISDCTDGKAKDNDQCNQMDRNNYIKMWHMIYQHVVLGIAEKVGSQLLDGAEDDEVKENEDSNDFSQPTYDLSEENQVANHLRCDLTKSDALKLVKEAVNEILLPEIQDDSSDTQSVTEFVSDQDISDRNCDETGGQKIESEGGNLMSDEQKHIKHNSVSTYEDSKVEPQVINKSELPKPKNWSKLKKLILLKRSIKALEKARKFKPQPHQLFPQTPDSEPEKIDLGRQIMDEKKKAEQWMLDYAVQHIVTKLTPARRRRVSMLVEAFEAVVPLPDI